MAEEVTIYDDGNVKISNLRAILGSTTFAMSNMSSVSSESLVPRKATQILLIILGIILLLPGIGIMAQNGSAALLVIALLIIIPSAIVLALKKTKYAVSISSSSGKSNALISEDREYIKKIVDALNNAIIHRVNGRGHS